MLWCGDFVKESFCFIKAKLVHSRNGFFEYCCDELKGLQYWVNRVKILKGDYVRKTEKSRSFQPKYFTCFQNKVGDFSILFFITEGPKSCPWSGFKFLVDKRNRNIIL